MAGSIISLKQQAFLEALLKESGVVATIVAGGCSVNIHGLDGKLFLREKKWSIEGGPSEETLLAWESPEVKETKETAVHFHVSWDELDSAYLTKFDLPRTGTKYALFLCKGRHHSDVNQIRQSSSLRFYMPERSQFVRSLSKEHGMDRWIDFPN